MTAATANSDRPERNLSLQLTDALVHAAGANAVLHRILEAIQHAMHVPRLVLYDYDETADTFDLLCFIGHPADARSGLRRRLHTLDIRRALTERAPFVPHEDQQELLVPLYFQDTLEAVLLLQSDAPIVRAPSPTDDYTLISRFLGLFMSSSRLPVNQLRDRVNVADLERAREVQMGYLPNEHPVTDRYELYGYNQPATLVGGDYFDYFSDRTDSLQCVIADACGHGMAAALIMSTFRGLLHSEVHGSGDLSTLFTRLNQRLHSDSGLIKYLTSVFFDYRKEEGVLRYFNAGHFDPLILRASGPVEALSGGGPPLGMFPSSGYELQHCRIHPGDLLVLFTDGLVELRNASEEFFGVEGALSAVASHRNLPLRDLAREVVSRAATFSHKQPEDDLTLFLMRFR